MNDLELRADVMRNINIKMQMIGSDGITVVLYDDMHEMSIEQLYAISLTYSMLLMRKQREC
jgi:hypothetical protein